MDDITKIKINNALYYANILGKVSAEMGSPARSSKLEDIHVEYEAAVGELHAYVQRALDRLERAEKELDYRDSGLWNRFRTWFGCMRARHFAEMEDINLLAHTRAWTLVTLVVLLSACASFGGNIANGVYPLRVDNQSQVLVKVRINGFYIGRVESYQTKTFPVNKQIFQGGCATATASAEGGGRTVQSPQVCLPRGAQSLQLSLFERQPPVFVAW